MTLKKFLWYLFLFLISPVLLILSPLILVIYRRKQRKQEEQQKYDEEMLSDILANPEPRIDIIQYIINNTFSFTSSSQKDVILKAILEEISKASNVLEKKYKNTFKFNAEVRSLINNFLDELKKINIQKKGGAFFTLYDLFIDTLILKKSISQSQLLICYNVLHEILKKHKSLSNDTSFQEERILRLNNFILNEAHQGSEYRTIFPDNGTNNNQQQVKEYDNNAFVYSTTGKGEKRILYFNNDQKFKFAAAANNQTSGSFKTGFIGYNTADRNNKKVLLISQNSQLLTQKEASNIFELKNIDIINKTFALDISKNKIGPEGRVVELQEYAGSTLFMSERERAKKCLLNAIPAFLRGLSMLHRMGLFHGDLKTDNICINNLGTCKIIDNDNLYKDNSFGLNPSTSILMNDEKKRKPFSLPERKFHDVFGILFMFLNYSPTEEAVIIFIYLINAFTTLNNNNDKVLRYTREDNKNHGDINKLYREAMNALFYLSLEECLNETDKFNWYYLANLEPTVEIDLAKFQKIKINSIDDVESKFQDIQKGGVLLRNNYEKEQLTKQA